MNDAPRQPLTRAIARRPVRVAAGRLRPAIPRHTFGATAAAFARSIADRYQTRAHAGLPVLDRILGRAAVGVMIQPRHHHTHVTVTPRVALTVIRAASGTRPPVLAPGASSRPGIPRRRVIDALVERLLVRTRVDLVHIERTTYPPVAQTVHRLLARHERVAAPDHERVGSLRHLRPGPDVRSTGDEEEARPSLRAPHHVPRIHRRSAAPPTVATSTLEPRRPLVLPQQKPTVEFGAADVDRLAERVIQVIDRRIVAQRERMGRM